MKDKNFEDILDDFINNIDAIKDTFGMTFLLLTPYSIETEKKYKKFIDDNVESKGKGNKKNYILKEGKYKIFKQYSKQITTSRLGNIIISESLFVSMISKYDAHMNDLLITIFNTQPEILKKSERKLSYSDFSEIRTVDEAKKYIAEKEIESVIRMSHLDHFVYLEKTLGMKLRENLDIWGLFIEMTERRNLIVHNNGIVSESYINNCRKNSCLDTKIKKGSKLEISIEYFMESYNILFELTVKLNNTISRKLGAKKLEKIDGKLNNICFDLISNGDFLLADGILEFANNQVKHHNAESKHLLVINSALSKYLQNDKKNSKEILSKYDWSSSSHDFKLAVAVINEEHEEAYKLMKIIGINSDLVCKQSYIEWPLFSDLRKQTKFKKVYKEIFGENYKDIKLPQNSLSKIISEGIKNK